MIITAQVAVQGTSATLLATVPPGAYNLVITNAAGTIPLYLGTSAVSGTAPTLASNGVPIPGGGIVSLSQPASSSATRLYGLAGSGTITAGLLLSNGS